MGQKASIQHDQVLDFYIETAKKLGRRVINLNDKSPDAIEIYLEDGKIIVNVIEIMYSSNKNLKKLSTLSRNKIDSYSSLGFDDVKIYEYNSEEKVFKKSLKRIPYNPDFGYTCRRCGFACNDVSEFQQHIYYEHTLKDPVKRQRILGPGK